jgi:hypothetical protein
MPFARTAEQIDRSGADGFFFTEAARGAPYRWRVGQRRLDGDALGPVRHAYDDAAEYCFMFSGSGHVETGGEELVLQEGHAPAGGQLSARALELCGASPQTLVHDGFEVVCLVVDGVAELRLATGLHGPVAAGTYVQGAGMRRKLGAADAASVLRIDCRFEAWRGVPTA